MKTPEITKITTDDVIFDKIYLKLWDNFGYLPDPVKDSFRSSIIENAMEICHETGDEESFIDFCVKTIKEWLKFDKPKE
jgi:hypothetical protein